MLHIICIEFAVNFDVCSCEIPTIAQSLSVNTIDKFIWRYCYNIFGILFNIDDCCKSMSMKISLLLKIN